VGVVVSVVVSVVLVVGFTVLTVAAGVLLDCVVPDFVRVRGMEGCRRERERERERERKREREREGTRKS
jgi:hypothetical protein